MNGGNMLYGYSLRERKNLLALSRTGGTKETKPAYRSSSEPYDTVSRLYVWQIHVYMYGK